MNESLEEKICINKLAAKSQRQSELEDNCTYKYKILSNLKIIKVPIGCMGYFNKGCYSCSGTDKEGKCREYLILNNDF